MVYRVVSESNSVYTTSNIRRGYAVSMVHQHYSLQGRSLSSLWQWSLPGGELIFSSLDVTFDFCHTALTERSTGL